jgi:serine/threonine protein kinase
MNLLLDAKWNVKVSDFGLTKFRAEMKKRSGAQVGSVHWSAPEVLQKRFRVSLLWPLVSQQLPLSCSGAQ